MPDALFLDGERVTSLRASARFVSKSFLLSHSPERLWPILSNTDLMNQRLGLAEPEYRFENRSEGGTLMHVRSREGLLSLDYDELPYEWLAPAELWVERLFRGGAISYFRYGLRLTPMPEGCRVEVSLGYVNRLPDFIVRRLICGNLEKLMSGLKQMVSGLEAEDQDPQLALLERDPVKIAAAEALTRRWAPLMPESPIPAAVARFMMLAPERSVRQLRPLEIARLFVLDPTATLHFFLRATKEGLLLPQWDLLCTSCQGAKVEVGHLHEVGNQGYCDSCGISYNVGFDENLEMTFQPADDVRAVSLRSFCAGGPANTPQILAQANLWPGEQRDWALDLEPGNYRLAALTLPETVTLRVSEGGPTLVELNLDQTLPKTLSLAPKGRLLIHNPQAILQTPRLESLSLKPERVSAAQVTALQEFRELFSRELLGAGVKLSLWQQTIVFIELGDTLPLFTELGDYLGLERLNELFDLLTQAIREHQGAIVQRLPKGVMAVFQDSALALNAVAQAQRQLTELQSLNPSTPDLRAGLQQGPCIACSNGERLDYQGLIVLQAQALQQAAAMGEVLLPADLWDLPGLQTWAEHQSCEALADALSLGDPEPTAVLRVRLTNPETEVLIPDSLLEFMLE